MKGFKMIRLNILGGNSLYCFRMFWKWRLIFWTFAPLLMRLGPLIFQSHLDPFAQRLLRASPLAIAQHLVTNLKQAIARTSFAIGQERQVTGLLQDTAQQAIACVKSWRSLRPHPIAHIKRVARSIKTIVQPVDSSGATFFRTLVYSASPSITWERH